MFQVVATSLWLGPRMKLDLFRTQAAEAADRARRHPGAVCGLLFMTALKTMPLADATALNYTSPVLVPDRRGSSLGERLTPARIAFIVAGHRSACC